jgi:hypothetical protein
MKDKNKISTQDLESINSDLFNSFQPEQELWIIGGSTHYTFGTFYSTYNGGHSDLTNDYDIVW